jgi:hypothetical protein
MKRRLVSFVVCVSMLLLPVASMASGQSGAPDGAAMVRLGIEAAEAAGVPLYARFGDGNGTQFLAGADARQQRSLAAAGAEVTVVDPVLEKGGYYLAYFVPGAGRPALESFGEVLLVERDLALLHTSPEGAATLGDTGVEVRAVTLDAKPWRPHAPALALPEVVQPDPLIQMMIDQVESTDVYSYTGGLSGEWPVDIGGEPYTIVTRNTNSGTPIEKATQYAGEQLAALGLDVEYHQWSGPTYPNVIGELPGLVNPDDIYIIGGHLDDMPSSGPAPGADDNASGSVATLLAAKIMTQFEWGCTLRFALWTGEEQGLLGSHAYAQRAYNAGENILGYLNLDMIAWNTLNSSPDIDLYADPSLPPTVELAELFADVVAAYNLDLIPQVIPSGMGASDHASFWNYGYTAILGIEDYDGDDFNPYYHTSNDLLEHLDLDYYTDFVKASLATFAHMSGCLIPGGIGTLNGTVTAAEGGAPIEGATVLAEDEQGYTFPATTDPSGFYSRTLVAGTYTATASAYGYLPAEVSGIEVVTDTVATVDFALETAPTYVVSGAVTEAGSGFPLLAEIEFLGSPVTATTNPLDGSYEASLPEGAYTMRVSAAGHETQERPIVVDHDQTQDFALEPLPCILLVDDDNDSPDVQSYYTAALDDLGYDYNLFDVGGGGADGPTLAELEGYKMVIWFSGDKYGDSAGPNGTDEENLTAYLDGGGRLFLSSQDYLYDFGLTDFGVEYLGIGSYTSDSGNASTQYGVSGDPVGDGLGPYPLLYPNGLSDYGDIVNPNANGSVAFRSQPAGGNNLDLDRDGEGWRTVFFGTSWVAVANANAANGEELLGRIIDWFGGCEPDQGWLTGEVTDASSGDPLEGATVTALGGGGGAQVVTGPDGVYTMTLIAGTYDVSAEMMGYAPETASGVLVEAGLTTVQDFALEPAPVIRVEPAALAAILEPGEVVTHTLWITNEGTAELTFTLNEMTATAGLRAGGPVSMVAGARSWIPGPQVAQAVWDTVAAEGEAKVIIALAQKPDLAGAYAIADWAERGWTVYDAVQAHFERYGEELRSWLEGAGAEPRALPAANAIAATVDEATLQTLASGAEVARVELDRPLALTPASIEGGVMGPQAVEWNIAKIRADDAWNLLGVTGEGVTVGDIGTGVLYDHSALVSQYRGNLGGGIFDHNYNWYDVVSGQPVPYDDNYHSTFGMGVVLGDDGGANQIGVAPGAEWIAVKACDSNYACSNADLMDAMEWMMAPTDLNNQNPDPAKRPQVGLNLWGSGGCNTLFEPALIAWQAAGILPVFAPGGGGPACGTVGSPADLGESFTAGATDMNDMIAGFSPRGPSCWDQIKPDASAPGVNIRSSNNDGAYTIGSGTSWAAAHLAGTAALVLSADPMLPQDEVKTLIEETALCIDNLSCGGTPCPDGPNNVYGWGRIDAYEAVLEALGGEDVLPWLSETPTTDTIMPGEAISVAIRFDATELELGTYRGLLDVDSNDPATPHVSVPVTLTVAPPCVPVTDVSMSWTPPMPMVGEVVTFTAEATGTAPIAYEWDLGDGMAAPGMVVTHTYEATGIYAVVLTATNPCGQETAGGELTVYGEGEVELIYLPIVLRH